MPRLDLSFLLKDRDFVDRNIFVLTQIETVGDDGLARREQQEKQIHGVVTQVSGNTFERAANGSRLHGSIMIHTAYRLTAGSGPIDADRIQWNNRVYTVVQVADYSTYGGGFVSATCDLLGVNPE